MSTPLDTIHVLHVDDDADLAATAAAVLEREDGRLEVSTATSAAAGLEAFEDDSIDCIVSDYEMPGQDGLDFLESVREADADVPFILYTGKGSEEIASEAISAGVTDYLQKGTGTEQYELLANRIVDAVERIRSRLSYREVFEKSRVGLTVRDIEDFELLDANQHYCDLMGYDLEELRELPLGALTADVEGYDGRRAYETSRIALEEGSHTFEWPHQPAEGDWIWVEVTVKTAELEGRTVFLSSVRDVTDRKEKEVELRETKDRLELALDGANLGVWDWDIRTDHVTYDERWAEMLGYSLEEIEASPSPWFESIHPEDRDTVIEAVEAHRRGETALYEIDHRMQTDEGDWKWIRAMGRIVDRGEDGEPLRAVGIHQDITERKEFEQGLTALHSAAEDLWTATDAGDVFDVLVETALEFLSFEYLRIATVEGDSLAMMATSDAGTLDNHATSVSLDADDFLSVAVHRDGESHLTRDLDPSTVVDVAEDYRSALTVPIGRHGVLQAFGSDPAAFDERDRELTELLADHVRITLTRLEQEERMREQRAALRRENERLEDFVRIVSHDLRNPLNVVDGHLELATEDGEDHIEQAGAALDRAFELIDDLLALAQEGQAVGEHEPVDLAALAERCWRNVETAEADLVVNVDHRIEADPSRCQQLLENLFRNAVEHGSTSPHSQAQEDAVEHGSTSPHSQAREDAAEHGGEGSPAVVTITVETTKTGFAVSDDGPGIPEEEREAIFEAGYSTREGGTGFGLSIVQEIAEAHGWDVRVTESDVGGARFEFEGVTIVENSP